MSLSPDELQFTSKPIISKNTVNLLGVLIESHLSFEYYIEELCKRASKKLHALSRVTKFLDINKKKSHEILHNITIFLLPFNIVVLWQKHRKDN